MTWTYDQSDGKLYRDGHYVATGYSGTGHSTSEGRNNPDMQDEAAQGPIPRGRWKIGALYNSDKVGPYALPLTPVGHDAEGRSAFRIHGDNRVNNASHGCIILPRDVRVQIWTSGDHDLEVVR